MRIKIFASMIVALVLMAGVACAADIPALNRHVNDHASMFSSKNVSDLEQQLAQYQEQTSNQIVILTVKSLDGSDIESFSLAVAEKGQFGQKGKDNGVLIVIAKQDRKMRIEVGYGLEGTLTDLAAGRIIDYIMTPAFKKEEFYAGVNEAVIAIEKVIAGEFDADAIKKPSNEDSSGLLWIAAAAIVLICGFAGIVHVLVGGIIGAVLTPIFAYFMFHPSVIMLGIVAIGGFILGMISRFILEAGLSGSGGSSGGGFSSGSSSFGGGGGFGGGGASGGW